MSNYDPFDIVQYNPARHGHSIENDRATHRNGNIFFLIGIIGLVLSVVMYIFLIHNSEGSTEFIIWVGFGLVFGVSLIFIVTGLYFILEVRDRNAAIRRLKAYPNAKVTRGVISNVRNTYRVFGRTPFTNKGDMMGGMDTGWFFRVTYTFQDLSGRVRTATGIIPDLVGPQRHKRTDAARIIDTEMPRRGQHVDVLFSSDTSAILKLVSQMAHLPR